MNEQRPSFHARARRATCMSAGMAGFLLLAHFVAEPLHARGFAQPILAAVDALGFVVGFPGFALAGAINRRAVEHVGGWQFAFALLSNFVLYAAALCAVGRRSRGTGVPPVQLGPKTWVRRPCHALSRRQFFRKGIDLAAGGALGGAFGYSLLLEPNQLRITRRTFSLRDLPPALEGLRIVQLSDLHHGPWLSMDRVREVVRKTNALRPDLILLTGDYVYESPRYIEPAIAALSELRAKIGIVGVLGNHDWWDGGAPMKRAFARHGLPLIDNARVIVTPARAIARDAAVGLCLAGVGDLWEDAPDYGAALRGLPADMPRLLLAHNPDCAEDPRFLAGNHRVDLMISGHTHGGQVWVPGIGTPILPSRFGQKYAAGLVQGPGCPVFISRGIGLSVCRCGLACRPEIVVMEIRSPSPTVVPGQKGPMHDALALGQECPPHSC